jgi:PAS domain S-box-containing protein
VSGSSMAQVARTLRLEPDLESPRRARRMLREVLEEAGREAWLDAGELAVSEVVTNAALHAHTDIEVRVELQPDRVRVEVRDSNPLVPVARDYEDEATTGRGMGLVALVALECGVESLGDAGKVVWFTVGGAEDAPELAAWEIDPQPAVAPGAAGTEVVLPSMPVVLWLAARQHHDAILRELVFYLAEHPEVEADLASADRARGIVSGRLVAVLAEAGAGTRPDGDGAPQPAAVDLRVDVPADATRTYAALRHVLDLAEALALEGQLLTWPGLPEVVAVREWVCDQVLTQVAGGAPSAWPGAAQPAYETWVRARVTARAPVLERSLVADATGVVIAFDEADRIVAVSRPLADLLGWDVDQLVGRRVVTIIPPALREAHVAGFSRHLHTGGARLLGVPLEVPLLHRDGGEVPCRIVLERAPAGAGRPVYLARVGPLGGPGAGSPARPEG